jgi:hypothetical protein
VDHITLDTHDTRRRNPCGGDLFYHRAYRIWRALNKLESAISAFGAAIDEQDARLGNLERLTDELTSNK